MGPLERLREWRIDRMTDRIARRPHGRQARETYGAADAHSFAWEPVLEALALGPDDRLLDVGCGGGVFLRHAHGGDRLRRVAASTTAARWCASPGRSPSTPRPRQLPFEDGEFTAVSSIVAFFFFPDPRAALREMRRVLAPHGRLADLHDLARGEGNDGGARTRSRRAATSTPTRSCSSLALEAGFSTARVSRPDEAGWAQLLVAQL